MGTLRRDWYVDWDYNRDDPKHLFRPWGFQPGHQTEWAKLLLIMERHCANVAAADWLLPRARAAVRRGAGARLGRPSTAASVYGFAPGRQRLRRRQVFLGAGRSLAAAALLAARTGDERVLGLVRPKLWAYSWQHFVDHEHGAWYRILTRDNRKYGDEKSPAGKADYHTMGACYEVLTVLAKD